eukprot:698730-Pyramimonas_sp.AAC.1
MARDGFQDPTVCYFSIWGVRRGVLGASEWFQRGSFDLIRVMSRDACRVSRDNKMRRAKGLWGVECVLAVIGTRGAVKRCRIKMRRQCAGCRLRPAGALLQVADARPGDGVREPHDRPDGSDPTVVSMRSA